MGLDVASDPPADAAQAVFLRRQHPHPWLVATEPRIELLSILKVGRGAGRTAAPKWASTSASRLLDTIKEALDKVAIFV
jgi:hypothetical protein